MFNVSMKSEAVEYSGTNDDGINQIWLPWLAFNEILTSPKRKIQIQCDELKLKHATIVYENTSHRSF